MSIIEPLSAYGILALSRIGMQVATSAAERKRKVPEAAYPAASLIVPTYNEPIDVFAVAIKSWKNIDYPDLEVVIVDDGSANRAELKRYSEHYGFTYVYQPNAGKREAMYAGLQHIRPESKVVFMSDSDTVWHKAAAKRLVDTLYADNKTAAVTGEVAIKNYDVNLITRLVSMRYHMAFAYERASQSYFKTVTCISGPLGAYRRKVIDHVKEDFINQTFMGKKCTYGDDRHLTNLVLATGYKVRYSPQAKCYTQAPTEFKALLKQQTRWGKSYWRELFWQIKTIPKHGLYLAYDFMITALLPIILVGSMAHDVYLAFFGHPIYALRLLTTMVFVTLLRIIDPMLRQKNLWFILFVIYTLIYFLVLLPVKIYALFTMTRGGWGSRKIVAETARR